MASFYEQQDVTRSNSAWMLGLLSIAIATTTLLSGAMITVWLFLPLYWLFLRAYPDPLVPDRLPMVRQWHRLDALVLEYCPALQHFPWELLLIFFVVISTATAAVLISTTRARMRRLREAGGVGVAESLGGVCISDRGYVGDERTRQAVNIVNEMAIASRTAPPHVYLLHDEPGINAFALGFDAPDMVVGLTAGALGNLNREQLQGVIAHEFAHIVNGDTRTNLMLIGYLHGLMGFVIAAQSLIQNGIEMLVKSISHGGQGVTGILVTAIGVLLWPVGSVGLICATVLKAAYSRQREYLADASALEYARNDAGLLGALKRIRGSQHGSRVRSPSSLSLSHAFFAKSCGGLFGFLDSHPPLEKRILAIDAAWDGEPLFEEEHEVAAFDGVFRGTMSLAQQARATSCGRLVESVTDEQGLPVFAHETTMEVMQHAAEIRDEIPVALWRLTQEVAPAEAMVCALWAGGQRGLHEDDVGLLGLGTVCRTAQQVTEALLPHLQGYGLAHRLMLFDACINVLRSQAETNRSEPLCQKLTAILELDDAGDLLRWSWRHTLMQLVRRANREPIPKPKYANVGEVLGPCEVVLSALAYANASPAMEELALRRAANALGHDLRLLPRQACSLSALDAALEVLRRLAPKARRQLILAGSTSIESDRALNEEESLLMRGICSGLGYPPATLLPGQPVALA